MRFLPLGLAALHLIFGDSEGHTNGVVKPLGFRVAWNRWCGLRFHLHSTVVQNV